MVWCGALCFIHDTQSACCNIANPAGLVWGDLNNKYDRETNYQTSDNISATIENYNEIKLNPQQVQICVASLTF